VQRGAEFWPRLIIRGDKSFASGAGVEDLKDQCEGAVVNTSWLTGIPIAAMLSIGSAQAADLAVKKPSVVVPAWSWTGPYGGLHTGLGFGKAEFSNPYSDFGSTIYGNDVSTPAALIGGQIGYNYQVGRWIAGIEADASWLSSDGTNTCFAVSGLFLSSTCHFKPNFLGNLTARLGIAAGPEGRTLLYGKAGLAVIHEDINVTRNIGLPKDQGPTPFFPIGLDIGTTTTRAGWTVGAGVEQAVTPAWSWKFEYAYQRFSGFEALTPETSNLVSFPPNQEPKFQPVPATSASIQQDFHTFKLGVNYKLGADPWATWVPVPTRLYPVKASPALSAWAPGWEFEAGARYWYNIGRSRLNVGSTSPDPVDTNVSRLTYENMHTHNGEFFGRIDSPYNLFAKGFVGGGRISSGNMHDEDWPFFSETNGFGQYSNTNSPLVTGNTAYGTIDFGYDWLRGSTFKSGVFVGYNYLHQKMKAFGCVELAAPLVCSGFVNDPQRPTTILNITESDTWHSLRIGAGSEILIGPVRLSGEAAYLPYVRFQGEDNHFLTSGVLDRVFPEWGHGRGVQFEAFATYNVTPNFSVGVGGRYWSMWTTSAEMNMTFCAGPCIGVATPTPPQNFKAATEQAGLLVQASYKFGVVAPVVSKY